jgi:hypothetical protein
MKKILSKKKMLFGAVVPLMLVLGFSGYVLTQDLSRFVPDLDDRLSAQTGQNVRVKGPLRLGLAPGDALWFSLEDVSVSPAGFSGDKDMYSASIDRIRIRVALLPLLRREILTEVMEVTGGRFLVENGTTFADALLDLPEESARLTRTPWTGSPWTGIGFRRLELKRSFVGIVEDGNEIFSFPISNFSAEPGEVGLALSLKGKIEGRDVIFEGTSGPWAALREGHRIYLGGVVRSESVQLSINGSVGDPATYGIEFLARGTAGNLSDAAVLFGYGDLKRASSMSVTLHARITTDAIAIKDIDLKYGRGDLSGWVEARFGEEIEIDGALTSEFLDLAAFEGARLLHPPSRLFSEAPLPLDLIRKLDGEISFRAKTISLANARLVDGQVSIVASDGVLAINPVAVTFEEGMLDGSFVLYTRDAPRFKGSASLMNFDIGRFLTAAKMTDPFEAHMHFGARLSGEGATMAQMFANANGQANLVMGKGRLGPEIAGLFGGREAAGLTPIKGKASGEDVVDLTCLVSRFDVTGGIARSRALLVQTSDSVTSGKGSFNLKTETIDLRLAPRPKNPAYLDQAADLRVTGTFMAPEFTVEHKKISRGIAGSLGRFALARRGEENLLPLIDPAVTNNNPCIVTLTGQKVPVKGRSRIYNLTQVQK